MRLPIRFPVLLVAATLAATACSGGAGASPSPSTSPGEASALRLRLTTTQAIPPLDQFGWIPSVAITGSGAVVVPGAVPAIYPGPLVTPLFGRAISDAGWAQIADAARAAGLLVQDGDYSGDAALPGAALGRIEILVDGVRYSVTGDPNAVIMCVTTPCDPPPGTPAAFGEFWRRVSDLPTWLGAELGPEAPFQPSAYALLVGPAPVPEAGLVPSIMDWPLDAPLGTLGAPIPNTAFRCATVTGDDAAALAPALAVANQLTQWVQDPETSATFGLRVQPLLGDEQPCRDLFGLG